MNVLLVNGSPHERGCTYTALSEVAKALEAEGVETEIAWIGHEPIRGCQGCGACFRNGNGRCAFDDDVVNVMIEKAEAADGYVFGSPVYYAGVNGALHALMDRMFYADSKSFAFKPAAGVVSARRAGTTCAVDQINKYFHFNNMPLVPSNYWAMVHGTKPEEVRQDEEGLQIMRGIGRNMAWLLKSLEAAKAAGIDRPTPEAKVKTSFIR